MKNSGFKCDIMVSEILDSVLLGEGVIPTVRHAKANLLKKKCKIIPQSSQIFGQLIYSDTIDKISSVNSMWYYLFYYSLSTGEHLNESEEADNCINGIPCLPVLFFKLDSS